jgi:hypothetical protein
MKKRKKLKRYLVCQYPGCGEPIDQARPVGSMYCSNRHRSGAWRLKQKKATTVITATLKPKRPDPLLTYDEFKFVMPRKLKLRLYREASRQGISKQRLLVKILEQNLPPYEKWKRPT